MKNESTQNTDHRRVEQVMVEKALTGSVPAFFKVLGDSRLHPVRFYEHPHLCEIHFTDGSVSQVKATKQKEEFERRVGAVPEPRTEEEEGIATIQLSEVEDFDASIRAQMRAATEGLDSVVDISEPAQQGIMSPSDVPTLDPYGRGKPIDPANPYRGNALKQNESNV